VDVSKVCDGHNDCGAGEDENQLVCDAMKTKHCDRAGCSQICKENVNGHFCSCKEGYQLDNDLKTCIDIDECSIPGKCSQKCTNTKGSYKCFCYPDYFMDPNTKSCKSLSPQEPFLLFANRHDLREIGLHSNHYRKLVHGQHSAIALDFDYSEKRLFWSDVAYEKILSTNLSMHHTSEKPSVERVVHENINTPDGLAVDWVHKNLYWTDTATNQIDVMSLRTNARKTLVSADLDEPRAIMVDPREGQGWMYWSDWGKKPKIEKAGLDGSHRRAIVTEDIQWPNGLTIDYAGNRLYWVDAKLHLIASSDLDGRNRYIVLTSRQFIRHPFSITVFEDFVYWTDWETESIHKANKFNGEGVESVAVQLYSPMDIQVYHPMRQPIAPSACGQSGSNCSHLCLPAPYFNSRSVPYACACPNGIKLKADGHTCDVPDASETSTGVAVPANKDTTDSASTTHLPNSTQKKVEVSEGSSSGKIIGIIVGVVIVVLILVIVAAIFFYRMYKKRGTKSMNFDNPVYRKTTEDQFTLDKHQYPPARSMPSTLEPLNSPTTELV